ncbi:MAG: serine/threonine-protein kinase [Lachnospira sp.]
MEHTNYSTVYLVKHNTLNVERVAKVILKAEHDTDSILKEANLIKNLKHQDIPIIYDIEEDDISICIIEEYISGKSLREFVNDYEEIPVKNICDIIIKLCDILEFLHNYNGGIIHLDLKPDNIIINENNEVKLIDFGSAKRSDESEFNGMGTLNFAAPEQYSKDGEAEIDIRADIYSVGMILFYMVSNGHVCMNKDGNMDNNFHLKNICNNKLYPIIKKCTRHNPNNRYSTCGALKRDIIKFLKKTKEDRNHSYIVNVTGIRHGIGTTHVVLSMAGFFASMGLKCLVADETGNNHIGTEAMKGILTPKGTFYYNNVHYLPNYEGLVEMEPEEYDVIMVDRGTVYDGNNNESVNTVRPDNYKNPCINEILSDFGEYEAVNVVVVGGRYGQIEEYNILKGLKSQTLIMVNLLSGEQFYEYSNYMLKKFKCYRMPCVYEVCKGNNVFFETMKDFVQDNFPTIWEQIRADRKKEKTDFLYEKMLYIWHKVTTFQKKNIKRKNCV